MNKSKYSLQEYTNTAGEKLTEIRLSIKHPNNKNKIFVLLEGSSDVRLFRKLLRDRNVDITGLGGKPSLIKAIKILSQEGFSKITIGICDADFDRLKKTVDYPDNLFITDYRDMEVQMIESDALLDVIDEHSPAEHNQQLKTNIKRNIYTIAVEMGCVRWVNHNKNYHLQFKGLDFKKFTEVENHNIKFNFDNFLTTLLEHSTKNISIQDLKSELKKLKNPPNDSSQICSGHDLTKLISIILPNNINQGKVESALRLAYRPDYFYETQLFKGLDKWFKANTKSSG